MKAIFITHHTPTPVGHGGDHRAYQIVSDLQAALGNNNVTVYTCRRQAVSPPPVTVENESWPSLRRVGRKIPWLWRSVQALRAIAMARYDHYRERLPFLSVEHPLDLLAGQAAILRAHGDAALVEVYKTWLDNVHAPAICVIEHVAFAPLVALSKQYGIPTLICSANIESFDTAAPLPINNPRACYEAALGFADEYGYLALCDERLFVSRVEAGLVNGLGLSSHYYPYLPTGEIRASLTAVRRARTAIPAEQGLFLMVGTGSHTPTGESFSWFIRSAHRYGLPQGVRVVVAGIRTDELVPPDMVTPGLERRGWIAQEELDDLLIRAQAVLVPQRAGFGALTRLPELSCAGIPALVSPHALYALDSPPGVLVTADDWPAWHDAMSQVSHGHLSAQHINYEAWERRQVSPLPAILERLQAATRLHDPATAAMPASVPSGEAREAL